jgi:hypothetical protein
MFRGSDLPSLEPILYLFIGSLVVSILSLPLAIWKMFDIICWLF